MTGKKCFARFATVVVLCLAIAVPTFAAARGKADFTRFVAIGDSYGVGFSNGSMNERHQPYSWPAIIARQAGAPDFVQPLVSYPGIGPEMILTDIVSYPPKITVAAGQGQPMNTTFPRPYNNLSIPGAAVQHVTTLTGGEQNPQSGAAQAARFILRGLGTQVQQAIAQNPTFIAIWIGGNDALAGAASGMPAALTPTATFQTAYNAMLDQLVAGAPGAGIVVGNLPTNAAAALPYFNTVKPFLINPATRTPVLVNGSPIYFIADLGGGNIGQLSADSLVLLPASAKLATGYGLPAALKADPRFASLPDIGKPLADTDVMTAAELALIVARVGEYNNVITQAAQARNIPVADINGLFNRFASPTGYPVGPLTFSSAYITGGIFSLDGVHMTDIGYTFFANQYIRTIDSAYETDIPLASIAQFFAADNGFFAAKMQSGAPFMEGMEWEMTPEGAKATLLPFVQTPATAPARRPRAITH